MPKPIEGVPAYSYEGILRLAGLATSGMLKRDRKRPADRQKPVGQYFTGFEYHGLYKLDEVVDLPPLSPGRQRAYDRNRTCAHCGAKQKIPFAVGDDGKRYCEPCQEPASKRLFEVQQAERRKASAAWAREVLADERTVLVHEETDWWSTSLRAEAPTGELLADWRVRDPHYGYADKEQPFTDEQLACSVAPADVDVLLVRMLAARRLVPWWDRSGGELTRLLRLVDVDVPAMRQGNGDSFGKRYSNWLGQRWGGPYRHRVDSIAAQQPPREAADVLAKMRSALAEMAATEEPADG